jgi:hypothetical protein
MTQIQIKVSHYSILMYEKYESRNSCEVCLKTYQVSDKPGQVPQPRPQQKTTKTGNIPDITQAQQLWRFVLLCVSIKVFQTPSSKLRSQSGLNINHLNTHKPIHEKSESTHRE